MLPSYLSYLPRNSSVGSSPGWGRVAVKVLGPSLGGADRQPARARTCQWNKWATDPAGQGGAGGCANGDRSLAGPDGRACLWNV